MYHKLSWPTGLYVCFFFRLIYWVLEELNLLLFLPAFRTFKNVWLGLSYNFILLTMSLYYICQNMWWGHQEKTKYADEDMMMVEDEDGELIENKDDDEVEVVVR